MKVKQNESLVTLDCDPDNIIDFQNQMKENNYKDSLDWILKYVRKCIYIQPYDDIIKIPNNWHDYHIWHKIDIHFDRLQLDLNQKGLSLESVREYKVKTKGFFKKVEYKEYSSMYYQVKVIK